MSESIVGGDATESHGPLTPGYAARLALRNAPKPVVSWLLVVLNIGLFVWMGLTGALVGDGWLDFGSNYAPATASQRWRLVTCGFLHAGLLHLVLNMSALVDFGATLERVVGHWRFLVLYFASLLGSSLATFAFSAATFTIGASGAILGLSGYQFVNPPKAPGEDHPIAGYRRYLAIWWAVLFLAGFWLPLDNFGHLGGLLTGAVTGFLFRKDGTPAQRWAKRFIGAVALVGVMLAMLFYGDQRVLGDPASRARAHYLNGIVLLEEDRNREALIELDQAVELSDEAPIFKRRAVAKLRLGDRVGAKVDARSGINFFDKEARDRPWIPYQNDSLQELSQLRHDRE